MCKIAQMDEKLVMHFVCDCKYSNDRDYLFILKTMI